MSANRSQRLLVLGAIGVGLSLAYCGGTYDDEETRVASDTTSAGAAAAVPGGATIGTPVYGAPMPPAEPSVRAWQPAAVPEAPAEPTPPPCPGCPPPPGIEKPAAPTPIDTPY